MRVATKASPEPSTANLSIRLQSLSEYAIFSRSHMLAYLFCSDIGQLRDSVNNKLGRSRVAKAAQSRIDIGDIKKLVDSISSILDVFHVRSITVRSRVSVLSLDSSKMVLWSRGRSARPHKMSRSIEQNGKQTRRSDRIKRR